MVNFEIHLTTSFLKNERIAEFSSVCALLHTKPLLIELARGECMQQPMATAYYKGFSEDVLIYAKRLADCFGEKGFFITRIKIEIGLNDVLNNKDLFADSVCYFEWHGKLKLHHPDELLKLCRQHRSHLSHNAIRGDSDLRFVSLRKKAEDKQQFINSVDSFVNVLEKGGWSLIKQQFEHCIYDSNYLLDRGWLE